MDVSEVGDVIQKNARGLARWTGLRGLITVALGILFLARPGAGIGIFLGVRLSRLAAAANDAITAAGAGDFTQLRTHLRRFDTLTSAIWAVQDASR